MAELVHRMGPDIMVLVLEVLATYQDLPPDHDLINDIISRAIQKDFRFTPQQRPGILVEEEHGGNKICSDCLDVSLWSASIAWAKEKFPEKPFFISETGAGGLFEWKNQTDAYWTLKYQQEVIDRDVDVALENANVSGLTLNF
eukprot:g471.t1